MSTAKDIMTAQYGSGEVEQDTSKLLQWLFQHFNVSRNKFVNQLLQPGEALLELGSGDGQFCALNQAKFKRIVGLDISPERVERAKQHYPDSQCTFLQQDLNDVLPFEDHAFDTVVSMVTLDWVYDLNACLKEVHRVLKPNGQFIFEVNNLGYIVRRLKLLCGMYPNASAFVKSAWPTIGWDAAICHYFTKRELERFITSLGFTVEQVTGSGLFYQLRNWWPSFLCGDLIFLCTKKK